MLVDAGLEQPAGRDLGEQLVCLRLLVERLEHSYFDQHTIDWGNEGVEFNLPVSGWFDLFRRIGWEVIDYLEPRPQAPGPERMHHVTSSWGYRYPAEQVWKLEKPGTELSSEASA